MKRLFHWFISIVAAMAEVLVGALFIISVGYLLYLLATKGTAVFLTFACIGVAYGASSYIEKHGWAWSQHGGFK